VFMRGGTSKAVMFHQRDLPAARDDWAPIFLGVIGAPDPNGRQLDGMGGGVSSLSKVCVIGPPSRNDADVDYTFAQVSVKPAAVDYSGNCGNMSSAIGPFALDEGLVRGGGNEACVRIHNTNTKKLIVSRFPIEEGRAAVDGDFVLPGVAGSGAPIRLEFTDPGGAGTGKLLPSGAPCDVLEVPGLGSIEASLIDAANPCVFVAASSLGATGTETVDGGAGTDTQIVNGSGTAVTYNVNPITVGADNDIGINIVAGVTSASAVAADAGNYEIATKAVEEIQITLDSAGDHVVVSGHYKLRQNSKVTVTLAAPAVDKQALTR